MPKANNENQNDNEEEGRDEEESAEENESSVDEVSPGGTKRGEGPDNLRRRSEWFQKRTGGR